jgi:uncharacterized protein (TIGR02118 family)
MIKVSVFYPNREGATFDMTYYCAHHMPLVQKLVGAALKSMAVEQGLGGPEPGSPPLYLAMGHLYFDSLETFQSSFGPKAAEIVADVPNYTNLQPIIQISEVKL